MDTKTNTKVEGLSSGQETAPESKWATPNRISLKEQLEAERTHHINALAQVEKKLTMLKKDPSIETVLEVFHGPFGY